MTAEPIPLSVKYILITLWKLISQPIAMIWGRRTQTSKYWVERVQLGWNPVLPAFGAGIDWRPMAQRITEIFPKMVCITSCTTYSGWVIHAKA